MSGELARGARARLRPLRPEGAALRWEDSVVRVRGLGPSARDALAKVGITTVADLVWTLPVAWDDARTPLSVGEAVERARAEPLGTRVCFHGIVKSAGLVPMRGRRAVRVVVANDASEGRAAGKKDGRESIALWWFFAAHGVLAVTTPGSAIIVTGRIRADPGKPPRIAHPEVVRDDVAARVVRPRYPRLGVPEATLRTAVRLALDELDRGDGLPDFVPEAIALREGFPPLRAILQALHGEGGVVSDVPGDDVQRAARERLAWAEAFTRVWERVSLAAADEAEDRRAIPLPRDRSALVRLRAELGFDLTASQERAIETIGRDLAQTRPMRRLLLGDVGTGKTAVALAAAAQCVSAGAQVAILAPTSILAEQYMDAIGPLARATGASAALVAAGVPGAQRRRREEALARGTLAIAVGTHALLSDAVSFRNLGLVVVDEQHRLGVAQRLALVGKGRPHLLALSATPIPRTLALALRGELKTCELDERPKGRPPVATEIRPRTDFGSIVDRLRAVCARGERAFVVAPRIAETAADDADEDAEVANVVALARELEKAVAPFKVGLVHGGLAAEEKRAAMRSFRSGETLVLVGTTVVEVGLDVPEATLIVVCDAERFGLAQIHQLRGRVGRGNRPGVCILVHGEIDAQARTRLEALVSLERGIDVAKADLALRGAGDLSGTRQSGDVGELLYLDPAASPDWLSRVEADARAIFAIDPELAADENRALRIAVHRLARAIAARDEAG